MRSLVLTALLWLPAASNARAADVHGPDDLALIGGYGNEVAVYGLAAAWDAPWTCDSVGAMGLDTRLLAEIAYWQPQQHPSTSPQIWDASLTPVLRWNAAGGGEGHAYADLGIGAHLLSSTHINSDRNFGTTFQFGEQLGVGYAFATSHRYEVGFLVAHVSNANITKQNSGLTYGAIVLRAALD